MLKSAPRIAFMQFGLLVESKPYFCGNKISTMGRGDKKTAKGKRFKGSFGKSRPAKKKAAPKKSKK
jgi:30S ribosomal protein S31